MHSTQTALRQPRTNMEVAELINQQLPANDAPYYSQEVHDYLISKGAEFKQLNTYRLSYQFKIDGEDMRLLFGTDLNQGIVKIQYWWEEEDDELMTVSKWVTHYLFSIPVGPDNLVKFKQILNAYIQSL